MKKNNMKYSCSKIKVITFLMGVLILSLFLPLGLSQMQSLGTFKQNTSIPLIQNCVNSTYSNISRIVAPNTTHIINSQTAMTKNGDDYNYTFSNTLSLGTYLVYGVCDENGVKTTWVYDFIVTTSGNQNTLQVGIFYIIGITIILFFLGLCVFSFVKFDNLLNRVGMIGMSYLLIMTLVFIAWNISADFMTNESFLTSIFRILFFVMIAGTFPIFLGGLAWYVIMLFKIKEIENLMEHGMTEYDAYDRVRRKRR